MFEIIFQHFNFLLVNSINIGYESDENGERFHQQMKIMEHRYQGFWDESMMGDYCWFLTRETDPKSYKRHLKGRNYFAYEKVML